MFNNKYDGNDFPRFKPNFSQHLCCGNAIKVDLGELKKDKLKKRKYYRNRRSEMLKDPHDSLDAMSKDLD